MPVFGISHQIGRRVTIASSLTYGRLTTYFIRKMVTLVVATTTDPASISPASALLSMPGWHPGPSLQDMSSFVNKDVRLLKHDHSIVSENHLDKRWEAATGEAVDEVIFLSKHTAASNRPALTVHPIVDRIMSSTSSPYAVTKIVRCRVRDLVSCFYACKFPLEEESELAASFSTNQVPGAEKSKVESRPKLPKKLGEAPPPSSSSKRRNLAKKKEIVEISSRWPSFSDDDYIVFCFKDDGEVRVLPDKQSDPFGHPATTSSSSRHVNLEYLIKLEDEAARPSATIDKVSNEKGNGKEAIHIKTGFRTGEIQEVIETHEEEVESGEGNEVSATSSDSNQSDAASTSSFAFPIIQGEWIGSPVQMPRPEVQKPKNVRIHCCRF